MAKRTIGKPRFYADMPSYLKSLGYYTGANSNGLLEGQENAENVWNMNPVQTNNFKINPNPASFAFRFYTAGDFDEPGVRSQISIPGLGSRDDDYYDPLVDAQQIFASVDATQKSLGIW